MKKVIPVAFLGLILTAVTGRAQHEGHHPAATPTLPPAARPMAMPPAAVTSALPLAAPPAPSAPSNPDPMAAMEEMEPMDHWMTMVHGYAFLTVNRQGGPSGDREFESQNHLMLTAMRSLWG